ncbi:MAG TPA: hypothetical protein VFM54_06360, partial [Micromonosporaceae bacterium]|nr:hypothetical protein [Micromonosporaceae bacterium]
MKSPRAARPGPPDRPQQTLSLASRVRVTGLVLVLLGVAAAVPAFGWLGGGRVAQDRPLPQSVQGLDPPCIRILDDTEWVFDPCIPEGEPLPPDVIEALEQVRWERACLSPSPTDSGSPSPTWTPDPSPTWTTSPSPTSTEPSPTMTSTATVAGGTVGGGGPVPVAQTLTPTPTGSPTTTASPTQATSPAPTGSPTTSPRPCPSETEPSPTASDPTPDPTLTDPTPSPTPTDPDPSPTSPNDCPTEPAGAGVLDEQEDKVREARGDRIDCRNPNNIPDRANPVVLVATGDSVTSAHHQWGFGTGLCNR